MNQLDFCKFLIDNAKDIQKECRDLIDSCAETSEQCTQIFKNCKIAFQKVDNLQRVSEHLMNMAEKLLSKKTELASLPAPTVPTYKMLPAPIEKPDPLAEAISAAIKCLEDLHIIGLSQKTVLTWPIEEAPEPLKAASLLTDDYPLDAIIWVSVIPPEANSRWIFDKSPFKDGYGVRFSTGHEIIYGVS